MLAPTPLRQFPHYPVTGGVIVAAIVVTLSAWSGQNLDGWVMNRQVWEHGALWRALTTTLPHGNFLHLAFNLYWLWVFGPVMERAFGHLRCAGIYALLALGSMAAEFAFLEGGIGLSGVVYGLWGMLWVLSPRDPRFLDTVDDQTNKTFLIWFVLCIVLTATDLMPVANIAHGMGAVTGVLLGWVINAQGLNRARAVAALTGVLLLIMTAATVWWPWVNLSPRAAFELEASGIAALKRKDPDAAIHWLRLAANHRHARPQMWYNLGVAYVRAGRLDEAEAVFHRAAQLDTDRELPLYQALTERDETNTTAVVPHENGTTNATSPQPDSGKVVK